MTLWTTLITYSFHRSYSTATRAKEKNAISVSRTFFENMITTREWNANHGGVYVPITEETQPNPYLDPYLREIKVNRNLTLTKINPAFMTRQIAEVAKGKERVLFHLTSLNPIRPENRPSEMEKKALTQFEQGEKEIGHWIDKKNSNRFFYMAPLFAKESCLVCHAKQGYKLGEIRGGISVRVPFNQKIALIPMLEVHLVILFIGLMGILIGAILLTKSYRVIIRQARIDSLTGVPNRRSFSEQILKEFNLSKREHYPLSLLMCDTDDFKQYNDKYGHAIGDLVLQKISTEIKRTLKRPSDFCARYGGDEFVLILPNTDQKGALHVANEIKKNINSMEIELKNGVKLNSITISIGTSSCEKTPAIATDELLRLADEALYRAKNLGKNRVESIMGRDK